MNITDFVNIGTDAVVICAVLTALYNAFTHKLQSKINSYRLQTLALALLATLKANDTTPWFYGVAIILLVQFSIIARLMAGVTNIEQRLPGQSLLSFLRQRSDIIKARSVWLQFNPEDDTGTHIVRTNPLTSLIFSSALVIVAYFVASQVAPQFQEAAQLAGKNFDGLVASLALLLVGLFIMINAYDTLAQTMGLLVMENGLFLAAVIVIGDPTLVLAFLFSMFAWYTLTLIILVIFLPRLRQSSGSIYVKDQKVLKE